ncbi:cyclin-dependent kinases regulatory subunit [Biomphalaria glabrata]|uniref:Cyclin-dependent kinases regulatory subunit n=2 Tax=Biomphalaria TaxID=6525 RepID=A0A2C9JUH2_BIOGL|nr:cyclin-dependent kinases regulatory subunit-like [Biomphalaria glabrata]KAI8755430.1 cyclin-dependent kinases regulatory subunit-like [Biomphalaria glabrata]KAI8792943.1 cyclin-dependent kinases regulatory subunit [Biomphalaria glabrata]KAK0048547.1 cyclin-dependent kinases regulatory subunit [Biomphalaria pfeifferi]
MLDGKKAECRGKKIINKFTEEEMSSLQKQIYYSDKYTDDEYEYRHVLLPKEIAKLVPKTHLMSETEWRSIGVQQSHGWVHYMRHDPEPHVLLFRRKLPDK